MSKGAQTFAETSRRLGARIRELRLRCELTQEELVQRIGMDLRRYQRLEAGEVNPTVRTLWLIVVNGMKLQIEEILSLSSEK